MICPARSTLAIVVALCVIVHAVVAFLPSPLLSQRTASVFGLSPSPTSSSLSSPGLLTGRFPRHGGLRLRDGVLKTRAAADDKQGVAVKTKSAASLVSGLSTAPELGDALTEALREAAAKLPEGQAPHSALLFLSSRYCNFASEERMAVDGRMRRDAAYDKVAPLMGRLFAQRGWSKTSVVGCSVSAPLSESDEPEDMPGVSITLGYLPGTTVKAFTVPQDFDEDWTQEKWKEECGISAEKGVICLLAHPESVADTEKVLGAFDFVFPEMKKFGAIAAIAEANHEPALFMIPALEDAAGVSAKEMMLEKGVIGLALSGDITVDAVVAQGARPIGPNYEIVETECNGTVVTKMREVGTETQSEGAPMMLFDLAGFTGAIDIDDVKAALEFLALGVSLNPLEDDPAKHQYIVRPITDLQKDGPVALNEGVRAGQVVRFQVRDAGNATSELNTLMERWTLERKARGEFENKVPAGSILLTDQSRGRTLYGKHGVETTAFAKAFGGVSLGGGFISGVIGELPNFKESQVKDNNISSILSSMGTRTYVHTVGAAFLMLYGNATTAE
mmetsp:Transcript_6166/g.12172  ORF Transcript_6166/g.12172 Transcript_6166/m.12172 type:complete len:561 (+) Transcript_6166:175-1857(+)